jgi:hypothetical protein
MQNKYRGKHDRHLFAFEVFTPATILESINNAGMGHVPKGIHRRGSGKDFPVASSDEKSSRRLE